MRVCAASDTDPLRAYGFFPESAITLERVPLPMPGLPAGAMGSALVLPACASGEPQPGRGDWTAFDGLRTLAGLSGGAWVPKTGLSGGQLLLRLVNPFFVSIILIRPDDCLTRPTTELCPLIILSCLIKPSPECLFDFYMKKVTRFLRTIISDSGCRCDRREGPTLPSLCACRNWRAWFDIRALVSHLVEKIKLLSISE